MISGDAGGVDAVIAQCEAVLQQNQVPLQVSNIRRRCLFFFVPARLLHCLGKKKKDKRNPITLRKVLLVATVAMVAMLF